jgi:hypothetical protein
MKFLDIVSPKLKHLNVLPVNTHQSPELQNVAASQVQLLHILPVDFENALKILKSVLG